MAIGGFLPPVDRGRAALSALLAIGLAGCAVIGPPSIAAGRGDYAEVINRTEDEQLLNVMVRQRYDETFGMMSVASITASLRVGVDTGVNLGFGDGDDYIGNLVPFSAGLAYEENPTISYVPLGGEDFMRRMLSPVSLNEWLLLSGAARHQGRVFGLAISRVNGLRNSLPGEEPASPEFIRFVELYGLLKRVDVLNLVRSPDPSAEDDLLWDMRRYAPEHTEEVRELLELLGVAARPDGSVITLPLRRAIGRSDSAVHIQTRSAWEVLLVFGVGVEVPPHHVEAGIVEPVELMPPSERRVLRIHSSEAPPEHATVQVRFRDRWFYIDARDTLSKRAFLFLRTFIGMRLAGASIAQHAPVLTLQAN